MARIDKLIQAMINVRAERLILASGEKLSLVSEGQRKSASPQTISTEQIEDMLAEIVPPYLTDTIARDGEHEFPYTATSGPTLIKVARSGASLQVEAVLRGGATADVGESTPATLAAPAPPRPTAPGVVPKRAEADAQKAALTIQSLFVKMVKEGCSDLHLTSDRPPLFRRHGEITTIEEDLSFTPEQVTQLLYSITPETKHAEFQETHDVDFSYEITGLARFRCNLFMDRKGMGGVFRVIPTKIASAQDLGLPRVVLDLCDLPKGLVVVTGPTGSGKSTTLAAMIDHINRAQAVHIITIEDPIEFVHPPMKALINQREIGSHTLGFKNALRAALREDPDIVLVGEMRDLETVAIALETAETGHLVFGTLHTNTAASTVDRIIDQFPADRQNQVRTMLAESLKGVIAQTLCPKKGGGRVAALEILLVNSAVSNLIREGKTFQIPSIMQTGRGAGMVTLADSLLDLVKRGLVEPEEAYGHTASKQEFKALLERNGVKLRAA